MKIYKITEASEYLGVSINTLKTLAKNFFYKITLQSGENIYILIKRKLQPENAIFQKSLQPYPTPINLGMVFVQVGLSSWIGFFKGSND